jgi:hypothetical protein
MTDLTKRTIPKHITTNATTIITAATAFIEQIVIVCSNAGTAWALRVQNREGTPKILIPAFTLAVPTDGKPIVHYFEEPLPMEAGIEIVTAGTTPGIVDVWTTAGIPT